MARKEPRPWQDASMLVGLLLTIPLGINNLLEGRTVLAVLLFAFSALSIGDLLRRRVLRRSNRPKNGIDAAQDLQKRSDAQFTGSSAISSPDLYEACRGVKGLAGLGVV